MYCGCFFLHSATSPKFSSQEFVSSQSSLDISPSVSFLLQTNDQNLDQSEFLRWNSDDIVADSFSSIFDDGHGILDWFDNDNLFWKVDVCCTVAFAELGTVGRNYAVFRRNIHFDFWWWLSQISGALLNFFYHYFLLRCTVFPATSPYYVATLPCNMHNFIIHCCLHSGKFRISKRGQSSLPLSSYRPSSISPSC